VGDDAYIGGKVPVMCGPCKQRKHTAVTSVMCFTCDTNLCIKCCNGHNRFKHGHEIVSLADEVKDVFIDIEGLNICRDHDQMFRFFVRSTKPSVVKIVS